MDKIMVVDDESDITDFLRVILEAEGYEVFTAESGDKALELAEMKSPDLVLLDLMMPGKSGLETCKCFKARWQTRNTPVIIFSALGREVDRKLTAEAGASAHLIKPFTNNGLVTEVKRCLDEVHGSKFSKQLGTDHHTLVRKNMLLEFDTALIEAINEAVRSLFSKEVLNALLENLKTRRGIEENDIPANLPMLSSILETHFDRSAKRIENTIARYLYEKCGLEFRKVEGYRLADYVQVAKTELDQAI